MGVGGLFVGCGGGNDSCCMCQIHGSGVWTTVGGFESRLRRSSQDEVVDSWELEGVQNDIFGN